MNRQINEFFILFIIIIFNLSLQSPLFEFDIKSIDKHLIETIFCINKLIVHQVIMILKMIIILGLKNFSIFVYAIIEEVRLN